jgi:hypothetical protein
METRKNTGFGHLVTGIEGTHGYFENQAQRQVNTDLIQQTLSVKSNDQQLPVSHTPPEWLINFSMVNLPDAGQLKKIIEEERQKLI